MAQLHDNPRPVNPYSPFMFRVKWDGRYVAGFSRVRGLMQPTNKVELCQGGTRYGVITLERGVTLDTEFEKWANQARYNRTGPGKNIIIEVFNQTGYHIHSCNVYHCWVSEFQEMPGLDANGKAVAIGHIRLENEGWERDDGVTDPAESPD